MFHTHHFTPSDKDPDILYCRCGAMKDLHRHVWEEYLVIKKPKSTNTTELINIGFCRKCSICGELKNFYVDSIYE